MAKEASITIKANRNWLIWLTVFITFCFLVYILRSVLLPFVTGIVIGYLFDPFAAKFEKLGLSRTLATCLVLFICLIILVPAVIILISVVNEQLGKFITDIPRYTAALYKKFEPVLMNLKDDFPSLDPEKIRAYLHDNASNSLKIAGNVLRKVISSGFAIVNLVSLLIITPVVAFYMLRDWRRFIKKIDSLLPRDSKDTIRKIAKDIDKTIAGFIRGQLSVCVILGTFYSTGLYFVGLELGVLIGFIAGIISFIPYIGSITGFVVSVCVALAQFDSYTPVIWVVVVFGVGQFLEGNFLTPKLVGDSVGLHPVWVMFALLAGGVLLGFLGLMIAVPVAAIIGVLIRYTIDNYKKSSLYLGN
ncbi:MAG: AI-2E family transporter [Lactobacillus sp.]|jgi:predicted PurR-regulated permease PerM|nr:AI-2E family transporter [Lactobacillus sp.]